MTNLDEGAIERVAIEYHNADGDDYTVSWRKAKSSYRGTVRKMVRTMFEAAERSGLTVVCATALAAKDAEIARLLEALKASRDVHAGLAEYILQANCPTDTDGMFADLQRARLAADAALAGAPDA